MYRPSITNYVFQDFFTQTNLQPPVTITSALCMPTMLWLQKFLPLPMGFDSQDLLIFLEIRRACPLKLQFCDAYTKVIHVSCVTFLSSKKLKLEV